MTSRVLGWLLRAEGFKIAGCWLPESVCGSAGRESRTLIPTRYVHTP